MTAAEAREQLAQYTPLNRIYSDIRMQCNYNYTALSLHEHIFLGKENEIIDELTANGFKVSKHQYPDTITGSLPDKPEYYFVIEW